VNDDYAYINARIRAMKSRLLDRAFLEKLMAEEQIHSIVGLLRGTDYGKHIEEALTLEVSEIAAVEEGIRRRLAQVYSGIYAMVTGAPKRLLGILLGRWDIYNIKTVLRGKFSGEPPEEVLGSTVPVCRLTEPLLKEMLKQPDIKAVVELLITWNSDYYPPLQASLSDVFATNSLTGMEIALDKFYFERSLGFLKRGLDDESTRMVMESLGREIDILNILAALKIVANQIPQAERGGLFIPGGIEIKAEDFLSAASSRDLEEALGKFAHTSYRSVLAQAKERFSGSAGLPAVERLLDRNLIERGAGMFRRNPLSIAPVIGYLWLKLCETVNLRIVCRAKVAHLPETLIREGLIFV